MPQPTYNSSLTLSDLFRSVKAHWRLFTVVVLLFSAAGFAVGVVYPKNYAATATLTVASLDVVDASGSVNMDTERVIAASTTVLTEAVTNLPDATVSGLRDAISVSVPKGSQVLEFTVTLPKPDAAAVAANAIASAYSSLRVETAEASVATATGTLTTRIADLESQKASQGANSKAGKAATIQIESLQESLATLNSATFDPGTIVSPAIAPSGPTRPSTTVFVAGAFALGLIIAAFLALARARAREARELEAAAAAEASRSQDPTVDPTVDPTPKPHKKHKTRPTERPGTERRGTERSAPASERESDEAAPDKAAPDKAAPDTAASDTATSGSSSADNPTNRPKSQLSDGESSHDEALESR